MEVLDYSRPISPSYNVFRHQLLAKELDLIERGIRMACKRLGIPANDPMLEFHRNTYELEHRQLCPIFLPDCSDTKECRP